MLQHTATQMAAMAHSRASADLTHCNKLQHTATHCNTLQHTATQMAAMAHSRASADLTALSALADLRYALSCSVFVAACYIVLQCVAVIQIFVCPR